MKVIDYLKTGIECRKFLKFLLLLQPLLWSSQNTAINSGDWNVCATWGNPTNIFRNTTDTKTINNGVTVTANENWSTAAAQLNGNGAINFNNGIVLDFTNDQGADKSCAMIINCSEGNYTINKGLWYLNQPVSIHYSNGDGRVMPSGSQTINGVTLEWGGGTFPVGTNGTIPFVLSTSNFCSGCTTPTGLRTFNIYFGGGTYCNIYVTVQ